MARPRPHGPITRIREKQKRGEPLTEEERETRREYYSRYTRAKKGVYLRGDREEVWTDLADRKGMSLSSWIVERVEDSLLGENEVVKDLRIENERLRDEIGALRGASGGLSLENSKLHARIEALEHSLMDALEAGLEINRRKRHGLEHTH